MVAARVGRAVSVAGEIEVGPPGAEADDHGDQPDGNGERTERRVGQPVDHSDHRLPEHDDDEQPEPLDERVGDGQRRGLDGGRAGNHGSEADQICGVEQQPGDDSTLRRQQDRCGEHDRGDDSAGHEQTAGAAELGGVVSCGAAPDQSQHSEQGRRARGERSTARATGRRDGSAERYQREDLDQEHGTATGIVSAVKVVMEASIEPGDPGQREHRDEVGKASPGQLPGEVEGRLPDQHDHDQVVEQLDRTDLAVQWLLSVRARRLPQLTTQPRPSLPPADHGGCQDTDGRLSVQLTIKRRSANSHPRPV